MTAREFWFQVFVAAISAGKGPRQAADVADEAVGYFRVIGKRLPEEATPLEREVKDPEPVPVRG